MNLKSPSDKDEFQEWFDDEHLPPELEDFCWNIWQIAFRAGGKQPWYSFNRQQWEVINKKFKEDNGNSNRNSK